MMEFVDDHCVPHLENLRSRGLRARGLRIRTVVDRNVHGARHREEGALPTSVVLRLSSLTEQTAQKVENWPAGTRDVTSVVQALCRLDTDVDVTSTFR